MNKFSGRTYTQLYALLKGIKIGSKTIVNWSASISRTGGGQITIGSRCKIHKGVIIETCGGSITIGDKCSINPLCVIYGHGGLIIGDGVRIAAHCVIIPANHVFERTDIPIFKQGLTKLGILIEDDVWIGAGVRILDGVKIAEGSVIGAGAVVTKSTEKHGVYVGIPARKIASRANK